MKNLRHTLMVVCFASAALSALAQTPAEHNAHHPAGAAAPAPSMQTPSAQAPSGSPLPMGPGNMRAMDEHIKAMQAMHEKMAAAKTPEERQALMAEHQRLMQDGMSMMQYMGSMSGMGGMSGKGGAAGKGKSPSMAERQQMMEKRMEMMESMMQMMMDRMPPAPSK